MDKIVIQFAGQKIEGTEKDLPAVIFLLQNEIVKKSLYIKKGTKEGSGLYSNSQPSKEQG